MWGYNRIANDTANIPNPVVQGNLVFVANGYNAGSALRRIRRDGDTFNAEEAFILADGHLIFRYDRGLVTLVEANAKAYRVKGQFQPLTADGPAWAYPVIHHQRLYLRHNDLLACYALGDSGRP